MNIRQAFLRCRRASVATVFALLLPVLLGFAALVAEYGSILVTEANNQRVADLASYAGALAYNSVSVDKPAAAAAAAQRIATMNGVPAANLTVTYPTSVKTSGAVSVRASITTPYTLLVARALNTTTSVPVTTDAFTEISGGAPSCILALSAAGTGVTLSGGTALTATACAVNSNNKVQAPCGTAITAAAVTWGTTYSDCTWTPNITATTKLQMTTTDPFIGHAGVASMFARVATVDAMAAPTAPTVTTGTNLNLAYSNPPASYAATGCTFSRSGGNWTVTCPNGGNYNFGSLSMGGGTTLNWATGGDGTSTYNFSGTVNLTGSTHNFGAGTYNLSRGINTGGGTTTNFQAGTFNMGRSTISCSGAFYSICHTGTTLVFRGPSTFALSSGISVPGGYTLWMGFDTTTGGLTGANNLSGNSYRLGPSSNGNAIFVGGGGKLYMADATQGGKVFEADGNFNGAGGGSCTYLPAAANHDIDGNVIISGAVKLGAGVWTVDGYVALGASGGGGGGCDGTTISVTGDGVNFMISGSATPSGGNCSGRAFCIAAGYSNVVLKAPTTGALANLAVVGPQSSSYTGGGLFSEGGAGAVINGAFYFPNGQMTMSGGASAGDSGGCLQVVATSVTLTGGTTLASSCVSGSGSVSAKLVR